LARFNLFVRRRACGVCSEPSRRLTQALTKRTNHGSTARSVRRVISNRSMWLPPSRSTASSGFVPCVLPPLLMGLITMGMVAVRLWSAAHEGLVLVRCELRHFAQECHDIPKHFVVVRRAPGRHARHFYPVAYDPKLFCWR